MSEEVVTTGRRKTAVASIRLRHGTGKIDINGRAFEEYFPLEIQRATVLSPFQKIGGNGHYDLIIRVKGGGVEGQVIASRLGLARALLGENENLHHEFKSHGYLTRDSRKRFQFSKR